MLFRLNEINTILLYLDNSLETLNSDELFALKDFCKRYRCVFLTEKESAINKVLFGCNYQIWPLAINFPNLSILNKLMKEYGLRLENIAFLSDELTSLKNARNLMIFLIHVNKSFLDYDEIGGFCPDLICSSLSICRNQLKNNTCMYYGEKKVKSLDTNTGGKLIDLVFTDKHYHRAFHVISAGRYFGVNHYLHGIHAFSNAIIINKKIKSKLYQKFDNLFASIFSKEIFCFQTYGDLEVKFDGICSVPDKPRKKGKFKNIVHQVSDNLNIDDLSSNFLCVRDFDDQKSKNSFDRYLNVKDAFKYDGDIEGRNIALIDDIITTGATISECVNELYKAGTGNVVCFVLAYNQFDCAYIGNNEPFLEIKNKLRFNAKTLYPFFAGNKSYDVVVENIINDLNHEISSLSFDSDLIDEPF